MADRKSDRFGTSSAGGRRSRRDASVFYRQSGGCGRKLQEHSLFSDEMLRLTGKNIRLTIKGKGLSIEYYDRDNLRVTGQIVSVEFGVL